MRHDDERIQLQLDGDGSKQRRDYHERDCSQSRPQYAARSADPGFIAVPNGGHRENENDDGQRRRAVSMRNLDQQIRASLGGRQRTVAVRPMISATHARAADSYYRTEYDLRKRNDERENREPAKSSH